MHGKGKTVEGSFIIASPLNHQLRVNRSNFVITSFFNRQLHVNKVHKESLNTSRVITICLWCWKEHLWTCYKNRFVVYNQTFGNKGLDWTKIVLIKCVCFDGCIAKLRKWSSKWRNMFKGGEGWHLLRRRWVSPEVLWLCSMETLECIDEETNEDDVD